MSERELVAGRSDNQKTFERWCQDHNGEFTTMGSRNGGACVLRGGVSPMKRVEDGSRYVRFLEGQDTIDLSVRQKSGLESYDQGSFRANRVRLGDREAEAVGQITF